VSGAGGGRYAHPVQPRRSEWNRGYKMPGLRPAGHLPCSFLWMSQSWVKEDSQGSPPIRIPGGVLFAAVSVICQTALCQHYLPKTGFTYLAARKRLRKPGRTSVAQFTAESLGRLLANVEREVLVDALEGADLRILLRTETIETIEQLQGWFNLLTNLRTFGPTVIGKEIEDIIEDALQAAPALVGILGLAQFFVDIVLADNRRLITVQDLVRDTRNLIVIPSPSKAALATGAG